MLLEPTTGLASPWSQFLSSMDLQRILTPSSEPDVTNGLRPTKQLYTAIPSACLSCRTKHLKCDGLNPCSRCVTTQSECSYVSSRRGWKGPRRSPSEPKVTPGIAPTVAATIPDSKPRLDQSEIDRLEREYKINPRPNSLAKSDLAKQLGVEVSRINNWFQNRRAKEKQLVREAGYQLTTPQDDSLDKQRKEETNAPTALPIPGDVVDPMLFAPTSFVQSNSWDNEDIANRLMDHFYSLMGQWYFKRPPGPSHMSHVVQGYNGGPTSNEDGRQSGGPTSSDTTQATGQQARQTHTTRSNFRPDRRRFEDDDEDSGEERGHKKPRFKDKDIGVSQQRLACPYFKRNATQYQTWRSCPGPGWGTVHRVKEHLYRCHVLPPSCPRCHETFETEKEKLEHLVALESCTVRDRPPTVEGLDPATHELLKSRKLLQGQDTEESKWRAVYLVLFPDTEEKDIPSPYYEYASVTFHDDHTSQGTSSEFAQYEKFLKAELPAHMKQKITTRVGDALGPPGSISSNFQIEALKMEVVAMVKDAQLELFRIYCHTRGKPGVGKEATGPAPAPVPTPESTTGDDDNRQGGLHMPGKVGDQVNILDNFGGAPITCIDMDAGYVDFDGFDPVVFDLGLLGEIGMPGSEAIRWE